MNLLSQVEYANSDALRRMAMNAQQLAREIHPDQLVSEAWLVHTITGVHSRSADTAPTLVGAAVIDDLAALTIRLTDRAPMNANLAQGGAFTLEEVAKKLGVGVRSVQRWRRLGLTSMRFQFAKTRRVGCTGDTIAWFQVQHAAVLAQVRHPSHSQLVRQQLWTQAQAVARSGGSLHAASKRLANLEKVSVLVARRAIEHIEKIGLIKPMKRRVPLAQKKMLLAWRGWRRGVDLNTIERRVGQSRASTLRSIAKQRTRCIHECAPSVSPLSTFMRTDAAETLLAPSSVREHLAYGIWPTDPLQFLLQFAPVSQSAQKFYAADHVQLTALRYLLWHSHERIQKINSVSEWADLDECETALRWATRLRLTLLQRSIGEVLARLQAVAGVALNTLHRARVCQAIDIALHSTAHILNEAMLAPAGDRAIRLHSLAAAHAEKRAVLQWKPHDRCGKHEPILLSDLSQFHCVAWTRAAPLRDDLALFSSQQALGDKVLALRYGWQGRAPCTMKQVATLLHMHPRRVAIVAAETFRTFNKQLSSGA